MGAPLFQPRQLATGAVTAALLVTGAFSIVLCSGVDARAQGLSGCEAEAAVLPSPVAPWTGAPLRVLMAAEKPFNGELSLLAPDGTIAVKSRERHGGPPYFWLAEVASPAAGKWRAALVREGADGECRTITREISVSAQKPAGHQGTAASIWPVHSAWNRATENLYSAWIEKLFDAPLDKDLSWKVE